MEYEYFIIGYFIKEEQQLHVHVYFLKKHSLPVLGWWSLNILFYDIRGDDD